MLDEFNIIRAQTNGRKVSAMWQLYGFQNINKCGDCCHLIHHNYRGKSYYKCEVYGQSNSEATDWRKKWPACGAFNDQSITTRNVYKHLPRPSTVCLDQIEWQVEMEL